MTTARSHVVALLSSFGAGLGTIDVHPRMIFSLAVACSLIRVTIGMLIASNNAITSFGTKLLHPLGVHHPSEAVALLGPTETVFFALGFYSSETFSFLPGVGFTLGFLSCDALGFFQGSETFSFLPSSGFSSKSSLFSFSFI